jgi:hypothetical protein
MQTAAPTAQQAQAQIGNREQLRYLLQRGPNGAPQVGPGPVGPAGQQVVSGASPVASASASEAQNQPQLSLSTSTTSTGVTTTRVWVPGDLARPNYLMTIINENSGKQREMACTFSTSFQHLVCLYNRHDTPCKKAQYVMKNPVLQHL